MTLLTLPPALLTALGLALLYWVFWCYRPASWPKSVVKIGAVLALAVLALGEGAPTGLIVALLLCALGDYLLSRDSAAQFMAGVGAFALGHVAYVWLFLSHPSAHPDAVFTAAHLPVIAALALLGVGMAALLWRRAGDMRGPVMVYIPVILSMGLTVMALPPSGALALAPLAAGLFILSDFTLSLEMFVLPAGHPLRRLTPFLVWPSYWVAQLGFTLAFTAPSAM